MKMVVMALFLAFLVGPAFAGRQDALNTAQAIYFQNLWNTNTY